MGIVGKLFHLFFFTKTSKCLGGEYLGAQDSQLEQPLQPKCTLPFPWPFPALYTMAKKSAKDPVGLFMILYVMTSAYFAAVMIRIVLGLCSMCCHHVWFDHRWDPQ